MKNFTIFTICTENYKDVIDITIPSWLKLNSLEKIYIYTDFDLTYNNDKVVVLNKIKKTNDWLEIVGLKALLLKDFLDFYEGINFAFIDIDCYIKEDFSEVFNLDFDIAATRMNSRKMANSGVWFCKKGDGIKMFNKQWCLKQDEYLRKKIGVKKHISSYSQKSFSDILHKEYNNEKKIKVIPINENIYNCEEDSVDGWIKKIIKNNPKIIHFKGRKWRDKNCMNILKTKKII
jgi:frataxin-like iron-binding protein CyaY